MGERKMKTHLFIIAVFALILLNPQKDYAQLKKYDKGPRISDVLVNPTNGLFSFISSDNFHMSHSISASYSAFGSGGGMMLNSYVNTIDMRLTDNLYLRTNIGIMSSPYNTLGNNFFLNKPQFFGGAELKYDFNDNSSLLFKVDYSPYRSYYSPFYSPYDNSAFSTHSAFDER